MDFFTNKKVVEALLVPSGVFRNSRREAGPF
jgi:hypothetical protein